MARFVVLVIDSFGVGAMDDVPQVRPQDSGANTCGHILQRFPALRLPTLEKLGLINALGFAPGVMQPSDDAVWGTAELGHEGGDTFMGHQEILGTLPRTPLRMPFNAVIDKVESALLAAGHQTERHGKGPFWLLVDGTVAVGDNLEADLGQVYNITGNLSEKSFAQVKAIGRTVREQVSVGRVIAFGGQLSSTQNIFDAVEEKEGGYIGINAPRSGAYKQGFQVVHMGYGVDEKVQVPAQLFDIGVTTVLVGKVADIVSNPHGVSWENLVDSQQIMEITRAEFNRRQTAFICTNIQETDLAGHAEDAERYVDRLQLVDEQLALLMADMRPDDCLVVMADHGNDPTIGHSKHTREKVPLLVWSPGQSPAQLGTRRTLSDVGATVCDFFGAHAPENGRSFLSLLTLARNTQ